MASSTARPQLHTTCLIVYVWTPRSWPGGPPFTHLWRTRWWLQLLKSFPPRMSVPNFSERSWPSSKRLRFLRVLQRRPTCSCYAVMPFSGTSISSPQFSLQCVQRRLKVTMWLVLNQRYFKRGSGPSRRAANPPKVLYLRSLMHPPTHLVCNDHLIANFLSFHMSLVVDMNCGAGNALPGFEISMFYLFLKLYFIHISKDILPLWALNALKQCK